MNEAANAPASSPPQQGAGSMREAPGEGSTSLLSPFLDSAFLPHFPDSSAFPQFPGEGETSLGFPLRPLLTLPKSSLRGSD